MATSRSTSESGWTAGASVFSGRPDPTWPISTVLATELIAIWETLASTGEVPTMPVLGYRGCFAREPAGRTWTAFHDLVTLRSNGGFETRRDDERRFERTVLTSAPEGTLPGSFDA
jgi:hypothetical protein